MRILVRSLPIILLFKGLRDELDMEEVMELLQLEDRNSKPFILEQHL